MITFMNAENRRRILEPVVKTLKSNTQIKQTSLKEMSCFSFQKTDKIQTQFKTIGTGITYKLLTNKTTLID